MDLTSIGKRIRAKRIERSWSQEELAEKTVLSPVYIGMIERGEKIPKMTTFIRIANVLEVTADELLMDVLEKGYIVKNTLFQVKIDKLSAKDKERLYGIISAFLNET